jgi:hypothetical protein
MNRFWSRLRRTAALLLAAAAIGHAQVVYVCASTTADSQRGPCCPPELRQAVDAGDSGCQNGAAERSADCASVLGLVAGQPQLAFTPSDPGDDAEFQLPALRWAGQFLATRLRPPPLGPPDPGTATLPGEHVYLATLRLRI